MSHIKNFKDWFRVYESAGFRYQPGMAIFEGIKDDLEGLVTTIRTEQSATVKAHPEYEEMMDWFQYAGNPPERNKEAEKVFTTPESMYQSMTYWKGDLTKKVEGTSKLDDLIPKLAEWDSVEKVEKKLRWMVKKNGTYKLSELGAYDYRSHSDGETELKFSPTWFMPVGSRRTAAAKEANVSEEEYMEKKFKDDATLISSRVVELKTIFSDLLKSGKNPGAPVNPSDPKDTSKYVIQLTDWDKDKGFSFGKRSIGAVPFTDSSEYWDWYSNDNREVKNFQRGWTYWLATICTDATWEDLKKKLSSPKFMVAKFVPITDADRTRLLNIIKEKSDKRERSVKDATSIVIKPVAAVESRTKTVVQGEPIVTTKIEEVHFNFPASKGKAEEGQAADPTKQKLAEDMAVTMFDSDKAVIKDNIKTELSAAVDELLAAIAEIGDLVTLEYKTIASTSDEPSRYVSPNQLGSKASREANIPLAKDRAAAIETAFLDLATQKGIDKAKIVKGAEALYANNTIDNQYVYETMKWMRLDSKSGKATQQTEADYRAKMRLPKFSGISFIAKVNSTSEDVTPTEELIEDYSVTGDWKISISWSKATKKKKGKSRSSKYRGKINWDRLFPDMGTPGGGLSVKDLCAAYG